MKKKTFVKIGAVLMSLLFALGGFAGCNKKTVANDENTLEIYLKEAGYGKDWLYAVADAFVEEFPQYNVHIEAEMNVSRVENMLRSGPSNTTTDLMFSDEKLFKLQAMGANALSGYDCILEDLTDMYNTKLPGEDVTLAEKMNPYIYDHFAIEEEVSDGVWEDRYYMFSWANSLMGFVYNKTLFEEKKDKGVFVPRTTEELYDVLDILKSDKFKPFINAMSTSYMGPIEYTWWAQYDGADEYGRYWEPKGMMDYDTMSQKGKLYAAQIVNQLYRPAYGRLNQDSLDSQFTEIQAKFIVREAAIIPCGDWFENEMRDIIAQNQAQGNRDEYAMMKTPVNSAVVEKLSFWTGGDYSEIFKRARDVQQSSSDLAVLKEADAKLAQLIDYVDGVTSEKPGFATDQDVAKIREARNVAFSYADGHQAVIPVYATAKEAAKQFLLFLATDRAQRIVAQKTYGVTMCYGYDPADGGVELTDFARSALDIVKEAVICKHSSITIGEWGMGLNMFRISAQRMASSGNDYVSPEDIYKDSILSTTDYQSALRSAGLI